MKKIAIFIALLVIFAVSEDDVQSGVMTGGYKVVQSGKLESMRGDEQFKRVERVARQEFLSKYGEDLGNILKVQTQVVAGLNYKILFESNQSPIQITIWVQPWNDKFQVTSIQRTVSQDI